MSTDMPTLWTPCCLNGRCIISAEDREVEERESIVIRSRRGREGGRGCWEHYYDDEHDKSNIISCDLRAP